MASTTKSIAQTSHNHHETREKTPNMLAWALRYAALGYHVFPCHEPLIDHPQGVLCTCEQWRHSDDCKLKDEERKATGKLPLYLEPDQHCANPGKHPRGVAHGFWDATTDPETIKKWWTKYPTANIAHVPGRAGLVALDADSYKEGADHADLLTATEEQTPTVLTPRGGSHLYFAKHADATYANAPGSLPAHVDVRADNGYALLPPSLGPNGNRYTWELGYSPGDLPVVLLPERIHGILSTATKHVAYTGGAAAHWDGSPAQPAPDLARWQLAPTILTAIANPPGKGQRSEQDMRVIVALCYAGATDNEIVGIFEHHPIGTAGKFAERGYDYLQRTVTAARAYCAAHPPSPQLLPTLAVLRTFVRRADFAELVPAKLQSAQGYRTGDNDRRVGDALIDLAQSHHKLTFRASLRQIADNAGVGHMTARRSIERLAHWFVTVQPPTADASDRRTVYTLTASCVGDTGTAKIPANVILVSSTQLPLTTHKAHDAFSRSLTNVHDLDEYNALRARPSKAHPDGLPPVAETKLLPGRILTRRLAAQLPSAGPAVLLAIDALQEYGGELAKQRLGELLHKSESAISRICRRLELLDLATGDRHHVKLRSDWYEYIEKLTPLMPTAGNTDRRKDSALASRIRYATTQLEAPTADPAQRQSLTKLLEAAVMHRMELQQRLAPAAILHRLPPAVLAEAMKRSGCSTWWDFETQRQRRRNNGQMWWEATEFAALLDDYDLGELEVWADLAAYRNGETVTVKPVGERRGSPVWAAAQLAQAPRKEVQW